MYLQTKFVYLFHGTFKYTKKMETLNFKNSIKDIKDLLQGKTLELVVKGQRNQFKSLNEFGKAVLLAEREGLQFNLGSVLPEGKSNMFDSERVSSFKELKERLHNEKINVVVFYASYIATSKADYINNVFGTNA